MSAATATTVAPDEVEKFAALAETWWDADGPMAPLHKINPTRLAYIKAALARQFSRDGEGLHPFEGLHVLDIGCGGGLISEPMCRLGAAVTGVDAAEANIGTARLHAAEGGLQITYRRGTAEQLVEDGLQFDTVLNLEVVEHVADVPLYLESTAKLVKPGGIMVLSTINRTLKSLATAKIGAEYILRWLPRGTHEWGKFVKPSELARGVRQAGLQVNDIRGMRYVPLRDCWTLSGDVAVNYFMTAVRLAG